MCDILSAGRRGCCRFKCVISSPLDGEDMVGLRFEFFILNFKTAIASPSSGEDITHLNLQYPLRPAERISNILNSLD